jgi:transcriptional regulator with XRE-family HTH domain
MAIRNSWKRVDHWLRVTRLALGLTEKQAAEAHCVTLATYRKWESGCPQKSSYPTCRFAEKYEVSLDWLVAGDAHIVGRHLAVGKVAILPFIGPRRRKAMLEDVARWQPKDVPPAA